ncbi:nucleotidyltransferase family protein [Coralliovum pocilloporae]|uniref:nucleotidyltransferase family protein n=1 Tax=Coralliovum pocilloporae TaxID=3066369 RepID=UPI003306E776
MTRPVTDGIVLSAGFGKRMRPITDSIPKPLVPVSGKPLIDYAFDALARVPISHAVVNVHYLPDQIEAHVRNRHEPAVTVSDERDSILETGGGIVRALPLLSGEAFFALNADTFWLDGDEPNLSKMTEAWDEGRMDALLLLAPLDRAVGYAGEGDFQKTASGHLARFGKGEGQGYAFAGAALYHRRLFDHAPDGAFSMNVLFDHALSEGRLFGVVMDGVWLHVGTPDAIPAAERVIADQRCGS